MKFLLSEKFLELSQIELIVLQLKAIGRLMLIPRRQMHIEI